MRPLFVLSAAVISGAALYIVPSLAEIQLLHHGISPWLTCILFGDLPACALLFFLGFRKRALAIYLAADCVEALLLAFDAVGPETLAWLTDLAPAATTAVIMLRAGLRFLVPVD